MAGTAGKWLMGCGLGCGALVLLSIAASVGGAFWMRSMVSGFDEAIETRQALEERFGPGNEFVPWPDGAIPAVRMETFLQVHAAPDEYRKQIAAFFSMIPDDPEEAKRLESSSFLEKLRFGLRVTRGGIGLAKHLADFFRARNAALNEAGMGLGEYTYIYVTAYYSWLGHSPSDEPTGSSSKVRIEGSDRRPQEEDLEKLLEKALPDDPETRERVLRDLPRPGRWQTPRARTDYLAQLHNLRESLGDAEDDAATRAWAARLSAEIDALERDPRRVPWQDGLPDTIRVSLEPYRDRLEDDYSRATNPFELARGQKNGLSIQAD